MYSHNIIRSEGIKDTSLLSNSLQADPVDVSIIIVNWKSAHYVQKCLESIYRTKTAIAFEIIVIDNASYDGCDEMLTRMYPQVRYIQSHVNLGFAGANNNAYIQSRGKTLLFLNPDTEVVDQAIPIMHRVLWETTNAGAIGCTLLNTDGTLQTSCIQTFPTILKQVLDADLFRRIFPMLPLWGIRPLIEQKETPTPVEVVSGACLMVKRHVFESAGLFNTHYFMYAEDTDLCFNIHAAGYPVYYTSAAKVIHHGSGSSNQRENNYFADVVMNESLLRFLKKSHGRLYGYLYRIAMSVSAFLRVFFLFILLFLIPGKTSRDSLRMSLGKWIRILRWSLGREEWAQRLTHDHQKG